MSLCAVAAVIAGLAVPVDDYHAAKVSAEAEDSLSAARQPMDGQ